MKVEALGTGCFKCIKLEALVNSPVAGASELRPDALSAELGSDSGAFTPPSGGGGSRPPAPPGALPRPKGRGFLPVVNETLLELRASGIEVVRVSDKRQIRRNIPLDDTPGLMIDGILVSTREVPERERLKRWLSVV